MIQNVLHHIGGVGVYGILSVCLFFAFFTGMLLWSARVKKPYLNAMRELPLDDGTAPGPRPTTPTDSSHE
jgi:cytochrome c oxidase cbb3-type subunit 4